MKTFFLFLVVFFSAVNIAIGQEMRELDLLAPTEKFNLDSLKKVIKTVPKPSGFVALKIWARNDAESVATYGKDFYFLRFLTISQERFNRIVYDLKSEFIGYFEFDNSIILVYGNNGSSYFFTKTGKKKQFTVSYNPDIKGGDLCCEVHDLMTGYSVSQGNYKRVFFQKNYRYVE